MLRVAVLVLASSVLGARLAHGWQTLVSSTPPDARPSAMAVDAAGNAIAVGRTLNAAGDEDALVVKVAGTDGTELWQRTFGGAAALDDLYRGVAVGTGGILAVGRVGITAGVPANPPIPAIPATGDALMSRFGTDGTPIWQLAVDGDADLEDDAFAVTFDDAGDAIVAGEAIPEFGTKLRFTVWKRQAADGASVWRAQLGGDNGTARAVAVHNSDIIAVGDVAGIIVAARFDGTTGEELWRANVLGNGSTNDVGRVMAIGGGRVIIGGRILNQADEPDFAVVALAASDGAELWRVVLDGSATEAQDEDDVFGVAVDAAGNVLAVGRISDATADDDAVAVKLVGATGGELWRTVVNGNNDNADVFQGVALDGAGDLLLTGTIRNPGTRADMLLMKLANATGAEVWRRTLDGSEHEADTGMAAGVGPGGDLVAAGRLRNGLAADGFLVTRRSGTNGGDFPCGNAMPDPGEACDDGNVSLGDDCRPDCTEEVCGDSIIDPDEACDDGNAVATDCCAECQVGANDTSCDDGDACTLSDACQEGVCTPAGRVTCTALTPCHLAICDPLDGSCSSPPKAQGAPCNDNDICTNLDQCLSGVCTGSTTIRCDDAEPCTRDGCVPALGCTFTQVEGFDAIVCTFQRPDIGSACTGGLPRPIERKIARAKELVAKAARTQRPAGARRMLKVASKQFEKAVRLSTARRLQDQLAPGCAEVLEAELGDTINRVRTVRDGLGT